MLAPCFFPRINLLWAASIFLLNCARWRSNEPTEDVSIACFIRTIRRFLIRLTISFFQSPCSSMERTFYVSKCPDYRTNTNRASNRVTPSIKYTRASCPTSSVNACWSVWISYMIRIWMTDSSRECENLMSIQVILLKKRLDITGASIHALSCENNSLTDTPTSMKNTFLSNYGEMWKSGGKIQGRLHKKMMLISCWTALKSWSIVTSVKTFSSAIFHW